ncbi:transposase [Streptomyces sp. NPDC051320]|uniref:transposase n=1 Tax=Streptomyces sp. NPDC051320 TaxID=3154644 RepID=UPI003429DA0F
MRLVGAGDTRPTESVYGAATAESDRSELFELTDTLLCADGLVTSPVDLTLLAEHPRGHGALYDVLTGAVSMPGGCDRPGPCCPSLPRPTGRLVPAVDVSNWLRLSAPTSADRLFCRTYGRGRNQHLMIPGWPYSFGAALESGRTSWSAARRGPPRPEDDVAEAGRRPGPPCGRGPDRRRAVARKRPGRLRRPTWLTCCEAWAMEVLGRSARTGSCASPCPSLDLAAAGRPAAQARQGVPVHEV